MTSETLPDAAPFPYEGLAVLLPLVVQALERVVDPEVALSITDLGLIYGVTATPGAVHVLMTMTSAACPVTDVIIEDVEVELARVLPAGCSVDVELAWEPPWSPDRMSADAKRFMQW
jgi:metal-sulfur cluster biosynthetic enzyme